MNVVRTANRTQHLSIRKISWLLMIKDITLFMVRMLQNLIIGRSVITHI
jgi:hypothetical protein